MWIRHRIDGPQILGLLIEAPTEAPEYPVIDTRVAQVEFEPGSGTVAFDPIARRLTLRLPVADNVVSQGTDASTRHHATQLRLSDVQDRLGRMERVILPLFTTPDAPDTRTVEWRNLWAFWQFVPGTVRPRVLLTLWTFKDWWVMGASMFLLGSWAPWQALTAVGAIGILSVMGFVAHEVWMRWWGTRVCQLEEVDPHEYSLKFTPTFERFVSRYMA